MPTVEGGTTATLIPSAKSDSDKQAKGKQLILASRKYAHEIRFLSWWHLWSTIAAHVGLVCLMILPLPLPIRIVASCISGLVLVRVFILYHDFEHGAILRGSLLAKIVLQFYGLLTLNPPSAWKRSHDHHHKNNSKMFGASIGSFPVMTTDSYRSASRWERFCYLAARHPLTIALGYFTIFLFGMSIRPLMINVRRNVDAIFALILHFSVFATFWVVFGWLTALLVFAIPMLIASAVGSYLFYAQHNFPTARLSERADWNYVDAALYSSSYIETGPILRWLTGNIGYHHVHHLNAQIPFYRLPEAMDELPDLQQPRTTSLRPRDIVSCLRLKLWDPARDRFVSLREYREAIAG